MQCGVQRFFDEHLVGTSGHLCSFAMNIYSCNVVSKDFLKSFRNLLQSGDGTSAKIHVLVKDLDILWVRKGGNVDLSVSKDDCSAGLIPDDMDSKYFGGKPVAVT